MERTSEHLEHAEHAQHAAHSPFDRQVALTMAIVAAMLACATMLSHRAHNETLVRQGEANALQTEANILQTQANIFHTQAADQWAFYQAKKARDTQYRMFLEIFPALAKVPGSDEKTKKVTGKWADQVKKYKAELDETRAKAEKLEGDAHDRQEEGQHKQEASQHKVEESHHAHHRGNRFDLAELAVELGLVLCSIAILTKQRGFWYFGMASAAVGAVLAASVFLFLNGDGSAH